MNKYLYFYNYQTNEQDLCEMEFRSIFNEDMKTRYYLSDHDFDYQRSVFIRGKLEILCMSNHFYDILEDVKNRKMCYYDFKVIYLKNEITHVHYHETLEKCKQLASPIDGSINMQNPKIVFALTKLDEQWIFGIYHSDMIWHDHLKKPHSYSHSLNLRDARTLVNLAIGNDYSLSVVDPCCGVGTVVLEALSMNVNVKGYDINKYVAYQARGNLEHFGYDPLVVERGNIHELDKHFDVAIMDIPYGVYSPCTLEEQIELLKSAYRISDKLVLVTHILMNKELEDIGYKIEDQCSIKKGQFIRYITVCKR